MTHDPDNIDPREAGDLLKGVAGVERRTRELLVYARAGHYMILWGAVLIVGYGLGDVLGRYTGDLWLVLEAIGVAGTALIAYRATRSGGPQRRFAFVRPLVSVLVLFGFGMLWVNLTHMGGHEESAFWPTLCGSLLFCFGLWAGRALSIGGALVVVLTMAGYFWAGHWFSLWLAATCGGALVLGGLWLRR